MAFFGLFRRLCFERFNHAGFIVWRLRRPWGRQPQEHTQRLDVLRPAPPRPAAAARPSVRCCASQGPRLRRCGRTMRSFFRVRGRGRQRLGREWLGGPERCGACTAATALGAPALPPAARRPEPSAAPPANAGANWEAVAQYVDVSGALKKFDPPAPLDGAPPPPGPPPPGAGDAKATDGEPACAALPPRTSGIPPCPSHTQLRVHALWGRH